MRRALGRCRSRAGTPKARPVPGSAAPCPHRGRRPAAHLISSRPAPLRSAPPRSLCLRLNLAAKGAARAAPAGAERGRVGPVSPAPGPVPPRRRPGCSTSRALPVPTPPRTGVSGENRKRRPRPFPRAPGQEAPSRFIYHAPSVSFQAGREAGMSPSRALRARGSHASRAGNAPGRSREGAVSARALQSRSSREHSVLTERKDGSLTLPAPPSARCERLQPR